MRTSGISLRYFAGMISDVSGGEVVAYLAIDTLAPIRIDFTLKSPGFDVGRRSRPRAEELVLPYYAGGAWS